ncbi:alkaline phosphatase PhoX [Actinocorallia populi]|uniref:alkaline phosphatase PhoX n=1 Tax=Actinocorallia populi TaxID=2079200 RepID=UPI000D094389|nr:alkaline phosphatase PhoX [Actinocorallia populi]
MSVSRRGFVAGGAVSIALAGSLDSVFVTAAGAAEGEAYGYGPLVPDPAGVLDLPRGFSYEVLSTEGEALPGGGVVPGAHDGMAAFPGRRHDDLRLVRNHEQEEDGTKAVARPELTYDPEAFGGTTTIHVDREARVLDQYVSLAGTADNCAGGVTPWGTWLTCEETEGFDAQTKSHGWVFEVDPTGRRTVAEPIEPLGRFEHEAVCIDPRDNVVYLTEDAEEPFGLFYRFLPRSHRGGYHCYQAGGALQAMRVPGVSDLAQVMEAGTVLRGVQWLDVPDPSAAKTSTRAQFDDVTRSSKLEGAWWSRHKAYFVASYALREEGAAGDHAGQVWAYDPRRNTLELELVFKPGGRFESPDNITVSPYGGGVILAEDGDGEQFLVGTDRRGEPFALARNALNDSEFAGVTFSPDGRTLFANRQEGPGTTFAIRGPWQRIGGRR